MCPTTLQPFSKSRYPLNLPFLHYRPLVYILSSVFPRVQCVFASRLQYITKNVLYDMDLMKTDQINAAKFLLAVKSIPRKGNCFTVIAFRILRFV